MEIKRYLLGYGMKHIILIMYSYIKLKMPGTIIKPQLLNTRSNNAKFQFVEMLQTNCWETDQQKTISNIMEDLYPIIISHSIKRWVYLQPNKFDSCQSPEVFKAHIFQKVVNMLSLDWNKTQKKIVSYKKPFC